MMGVPLPNTNIASKVVFTTRSFEVCGEMEANRNFEVQFLSHEAAWELFKMKVGEDTLNCHFEIPKLAETVVKECDGLPIALVTIGRAMACKKTLEEWNYAVQVLSTSACKFAGMGEKVYPLLKFSYDSLPNNKTRSCFLYCSLFPEDYSLFKEDLIDYWICEGFLRGNDRNKAKNQGYHIIGVLLHSCLLEEENNHVKMHDMIRDMALWIACEVDKKKESFLVRTGNRLTEAPKVEKWKEVRRMSLMKNQIEVLPETPTCPYLLTLLLSFNRFKRINIGFFEFMPCLRVLNLSYNDYLFEFPSGISKLVSLEHLDISGTAIESLPMDLVALVNLKYLNLEHTLYLTTIPTNLISSFSKLLVLRMLECRILSLWGMCDELMKELLCLKHLNVLTITLINVNALKILLSSHELKRCTQSLCLQVLDESESLKISDLENMNKLNTLYIWSCKGLEKLDFELSASGFNNLHTIDIEFCLVLRDLTCLINVHNLQRLRIADCYNMEEIISVSKRRWITKPFGALQFLVLQMLPDLESIYHDVLPFLCLKEIFVHECPKVKKLPIGSNSAKGCKIAIKGRREWWEELQWKDEATRNYFLPCFKST